MTNTTVHAFNHNPQMASAATACGTPSAPRGPQGLVNCADCLSLLDEHRWTFGAIIDMEAEAYAEKAEREAFTQNRAWVARHNLTSGRREHVNAAIEVDHAEALAENEQRRCPGHGPRRETYHCDGRCQRPIHARNRVAAPSTALVDVLRYHAEWATGESGFNAENLATAVYGSALAGAAADGLVELQGRDFITTDAGLAVIRSARVSA